MRYYELLCGKIVIYNGAPSLEYVFNEMSINEFCYWLEYDMYHGFPDTQFAYACARRDQVVSAGNGGKLDESTLLPIIQIHKTPMGEVVPHGGKAMMATNALAFVRRNSVKQTDETKD